jgi:hypothetical protein
MIKLAWPDIRHVTGTKWRYCVRCGAAYSQYEMDFEGATVAPTVGETLTGATSGKTATVESVTTVNGSYTAHTMRGTIVVTSPSGDFTDGEKINGSSSGAAFLTCRAYIERKYGVRYPETMLSQYNGKDYCHAHFAALAKSVIYDKEGRVDIDDSTY